MPRTQPIVAACAFALVAMMPIARARAEPWTRRQLQVGDLSVELPAAWTLQTAGQDRIIVREYPAKELISALSVEVFPATASLKWWKDYHRENELVAKYPDGEITQDESIKVGEFPGHSFRVTGLGADRRGYDLFQTIVATGRHFVILSLYYPGGRARDYEALFEHVATSLRRDSEGVSVQAKPKPLGPPASDQIDWVRSFDEALTEAKRRHVPIMIAFNMDNEWANDLIAKDYYHHPAVVKRSREMVCLIASVFDHSGGTDLAGGRRAECERFGRVACSDHRDVDIAVRDKYIRSKKVIAPQHVFCDPEGDLLIRREWHLEMSDLLKLMDRSISAVKRGSEEDTSLTLEALLERYRKAPDAAARDWIVSDALYSGNQDLASRFLDTLLGTGNKDELVVLMDALRYAGHPAGAPAALKGLTHSADGVRNHAAVALEVIASETATDSLVKRLTSETDERVRKNLIRAIGVCAKEESRIANVIIGRTRKGGVLERTNALIALSNFPENDKALKLLKKTVKTADSGPLRAAAAWSLGFVRADGAREILEAQQAVETDPMATNAIRQAIERIDGTLDWKIAYEESLERIAGDKIFRREK